MKPIKMLGLAALAALMAMAFVGAGSAMAESTALCTEDASLCPEGNTVTHVHESTLSDSKAKLLSSIVNIECEVLFLGDAIGETESPLEILGNFTYTNCETESGTGCTVTEESEDVTIKVLKLGHELADVTGEGEVNAHCGALINCTYDGTGLPGHGLGPLLASETNGETRIEGATVNKTGGAFCPKTAKLDILTTPLSTTYVNIPGKMACLKVPNSRGNFLAKGDGRTCTLGDWPLTPGEYELAEVARNIPKGKMACGEVSENRGGHFLEFGLGVECEVEHNFLRLGKYELGEV